MGETPAQRDPAGQCEADAIVYPSRTRRAIVVIALRHFRNSSARVGVPLTERESIRPFPSGGICNESPQGSGEQGGLDED